MAVLAGFACGERSKRPDRQAEVETNAVDVAGADAGTGQNEQTVLRQKLRNSSTSGRIASWPRSMMERPPIFTTCTQGRSRIGRPPATGRVRSSSRRVLACERRGDVLDLVGVSHGEFSLARGNDGADMLAGKRAGEVAGDEAVDDLHLADVACRGEQIEHREFEDRTPAVPWPSSRPPRSSG